MRKYLLLFLLLCASAASAQTIADKLTTINGIKLDIKAALASKSQTVGDDFSVYDDAVASITTGGYKVPDIYPAGLEEDYATPTLKWSVGQDTGGIAITGLAYCGLGRCIATLNSSNNQVIYRSIDYGRTFSLVSTTAASSVLREVDYCGEGVVLAAGGEPARIYRSTDYGVTWSIITPNTVEGYLLGLVYLGSSTAIVGTGYSNGHILRSTDNGANWSGTYDTGLDYIWTICSLGSGTAMAGGATGSNESIIITTDYGANWSSVATGWGSTTVQSLAYLGNGHVLAGTGSGKIYISENSGATWSLATDTTETTITSMAYFENDIVYAGTLPNGLILESTDGGKTWPTVVKDTSASFVRALAYLGGNVGIAGMGDDSGNDAIIVNYGRHNDKDTWKP